MSTTASPYLDELGLAAPVRADHSQRRMPEEGFFTGPSEGERLPDFVLRSASGGRVDFHRHRNGAKAVVVFHRSAVW